jgi:hypothetical protein
MAVVHQPRIAWDGARAIVRAAGSAHYEGFANHVLQQLGSEMYGDFADTRQRLLTAYVETGGDRYIADVEAGKWRVRLEDLLREHPELNAAVLDLTTEALEF